MCRNSWLGQESDFIGIEQNKPITTSHLIGPTRKSYSSGATNQRKQLLEIVHNGKQKAKTITHARTLLQADAGEDGPGLRAKAIAVSLNIHERTVHRVRESFANHGLEVALHRKKHRQYKPRILDGDQEAHLVALCCGTPPEGRKEWTLKLLGERLVQLEITDSISRSTIHRTRVVSGKRSAS